MLLVIDNYDSFTYNLVQAFGRLGERPRVVRNDEITVEEAERWRPDRIVVSPGPCGPPQAGVSNAVIRAFSGRCPILGVCLGHQCIAHVFGGRVVRAREPRHGKVSRITHDAASIYRGLPSPFEGMRYNSLIVEEDSLPPELQVTARSEAGEIMGLRHSKFPVEGVQFHPESYRTPEGERLLQNFLSVR
jgi:anthranilate synthase/aminodeoxychorismate synthase-like glutamine amidotransferase